MTLTLPAWGNRLLSASVLLMILAIPVGLSAAPLTLTATNQLSGAQNVVVGTPGSTSAINVSFGGYVVGPAGIADTYERPIVPFLGSDFAALAGGTVTSAVLRFSTTFDFLESGESYTSLVRLFSTTETSLTTGNRDVFAALTGDGGPSVDIGSILFQNDVFGNRSITLGGPSLAALQAMINGGDATIGVAFREFIGNDTLDEVVLGRTLTLEVTGDTPPPPPPVPEPTSMLLLGAGLVGVAARVRRRS